MPQRSVAFAPHRYDPAALEPGTWNPETNHADHRSTPGGFL